MFKVKDGFMRWTPWSIRDYIYYARYWLGYTIMPPYYKAVINDVNAELGKRLLEKLQKIQEDYKDVP